MTVWSSTPELREVRGGVVRGAITPPPSKSWTQRCLNLALLSGRACRLARPLEAEDTWAFAAVLERLGWRVGRRDGSWDLVPPRGLPAAARLDCQASGTLYRLLVAALAVIPGDWVIDGVSRLRERPIAPLVNALRDLGAEIEYLERDGCAPLRVRGGTVAGGRCRLDGSASSQFLSALLMAGVATREGVVVEVQGLTSQPYVALTAAALERFGGRVRWETPRTVVAPPAKLRADEVEIEPDASAACYPAAAAALTGGEVLLRGVSRDSGQGDVGFLDLLERMGAEVRWQPDGVEVRGTASLRGVDADLAAMPDQGPTLAALAPFALGSTVLRGVAHLRHKESDRLAAMAAELERLGATVVETPDGLGVDGTWAEGTPCDRTEVESHGDHRIAMSLAVLGLRRPGVVVRSPEVVAKSYPRFWEDLEALLS
ncbi:MAG: 3-phosphoshikimate 1-carboxyvinyltransferase [Thermoanaerobaculia bacterium]